MEQPQWIRGGLRTQTVAEKPPPAGNSRGPEGRAISRGRQYVRHRPWDLRLHDWLMSWVITPLDRDPRLFQESTSVWSALAIGWFWRLRRVKLWLAGRYTLGRTLILAVTGPRVTANVLADRQWACAGCPFLRVRLPARRSGRARRYCGSCGCPDWWLSELGRKSGLALAECPQRRWPVSPDWQDDVIAEIEAEFRVVTGAAVEPPNARGNDLAESDGPVGRASELDERGP